MQKLTGIFNKHHNEKGSILLGVVVLSIIVGVTISTMMTVAANTSRNVASALDDSKAFYAAESGLLLAAALVTDSSNWRASFERLMDGAVVEDVLPGFEANGFHLVVDVEKTDSGVIIHSTALCRSPLGYDKIIRQYAESRASSSRSSSPFTYAGYGKAQVAISGNGKTDSYNSDSGSYGGSNLDSQGDVGTNGTASGAITLSGNATVNGDAVTGPGGTVTLNGNAKVNGTTSDDCSENYPSVTVPASLTGLSSGGSYSLVPCNS